MTLQQHLVATAAVGAILAPVAPVEGVALFAVGSVLIDVDHLIFYFVRTGRLDVSGMFTYFRENVDRNIHSIPYLGVCVLHTVEFLLAVALSALIFPLLGYLLAGLIFHLCLDIWDLVRLKVPFIRAYSLVEHLVRRRTPGYPFA